MRLILPLIAVLLCGAALLVDAADDAAAQAAAARSPSAQSTQADAR